MNKLPIWRRYDRFFGHDSAADVRDELDFHIESKIADLIADGMSPEAARHEAYRQFGRVQEIEEIGVHMGDKMERKKHLVDYWNDLGQDIRYTLRTLRRDAGFTTVAVLILALAIGANIAVFSVVNTLLLRPLPFPNAHQLVWIAPPPTKCGQSCATYSSDGYEEFRDMSRSYQDITGYFAFSGPDNLSLKIGQSDPIPATGIDVITNFFQVLGVQPQMGRLFTPADSRNGAAPVILLSNGWWKHQFNGDPNIVGKAIDISGTQTTVIGVLPASFDFGAVFQPGSRYDAFTPLNLDQDRNYGNIVTLLGRMKPGVTVEQAKAEAAIVAPRLYFRKSIPNTLGQYTGSLVPVPLKDYVSGKLRRSLIVLWSAVGAILLIACVNLSNLLLARASARSKEFAMRGALGASRARIIRQLLTESLMLSAAGAVLGLVLAGTLLFWLSHQGSVALPLLATLHIDMSSLLWTVLIAIVTAACFGLLPGIRMAGVNLQEAIKDSGTGTGQSRKHERVRSILVVTEVALACMLLVGAGLLLRSFLKVVNLDLGFESAHSAAVNVDYDDNVPNDRTGALSAAKRGVIFQQIISRVTAIPGIEAAGTSDYLPLGRNRAWGVPTPQGRNPDDFRGADSPLVYVVSPGYVRAMGMRVHGRDFTWDDGPAGEGVVLISAGMARYLWPNEDAVGKILINAGQFDHARVVGVVGDVHADNVEAPTGWQIYYPMMQTGPNGAQLVLRTTLPPAALATSVMHVLKDLNPKQTNAEFLPIQTLIDHANSPRRFFMLLVVSFATLGLILAALGIYGVISYSVTRQTQEIGIRMALGSSAGRVQRKVLVGTLRLALVGIVLGTAASLGAARLIAALLFDVSPWDTATFIAMALTLIAVAVLSGYLPARRASRINPMVALRNS
ncbi:ABC transporter permease [Terracidiphilus gabretensis]|uniref:ABC transporter permease n=1 Tax=Terracidiphilus gabretensis TaxID=1577687 RepID=UPI00071C033B